MKKEHGTIKDYIKDGLKQVGGDHYTKKKLQPWEVRLRWGLDPWTSDVLRYISRFSDKGGLQDIEKAIHCLEFVRENYEEIIEKYYGKNTRKKS
tara:strand:+ start:5007 stop:5288 length:282 start_codon:yes stop_codon:yes gene_type:complete